MLTRRASRQGKGGTKGIDHESLIGSLARDTETIRQSVADRDPEQLGCPALTRERDALTYPELIRERDVQIVPESPFRPRLRDRLM